MRGREVAQLAVSRGVDEEKAARALERRVAGGAKV
jgi:hypothetical protein